jgi:hypothetical protein
MSLAGALGGSLLALLLGNSAGRKSELLAAAAFYGEGGSGVLWDLDAPRPGCHHT